MHEVPSLRARIVAVNGVPADQVQATPDTRWALRGDRGLTYAATPPEGTQLVAGQWWPADYSGPPLVSFDAGLAKGWGVGVGDTHPGQRARPRHRPAHRQPARHRLALAVAQLRHGRQPRPAGARAAHPYRHRPRGRTRTRARCCAPSPTRCPTSPASGSTDVLAAVAALLDQIAAALAATGSLTLLAGALVLVGAVAAGQRRRTREAVILKTLGATRAQIRAAWLVEFGVLGLAAGLIAAAGRHAASFGVVRYIMHTDWAFLPGTLAVTLAGCLAMMLVFGYAGTAAALRAKAAPLLRNE